MKDTEWRIESPRSAICFYFVERELIPGATFGLTNIVNGSFVYSRMSACHSIRVAAIASPQGGLY